MIENVTSLGHVKKSDPLRCNLTVTTRTATPPAVQVVYRVCDDNSERR